MQSVEAVSAVLDLNGGFLREPYLIVGDEDYYVQFDGKLVKLEALRRMEGLRLDEIVEEKGIDAVNDIIDPEKVETFPHVGIGRKKGKVADDEKGLINQAEFMDYEVTFRKAVEIGVDVHGADTLIVQGAIARLGGEGRTVKIGVVKDANRLGFWRFVEGALRRIDRDAYIYIVSPCLLKADRTRKFSQIDENCWVGPDVREGFQELMRELAELDDVGVDYLMGSVSLLGAGFDLKRRVRKPSYVSLTPGSIIKVSSKSKLRDFLRTLYTCGLSDVAGDLGYGTFLPLKAPRE